MNDRLVVHPIGNDLFEKTKYNAMENLDAARSKQLREKAGSPDKSSVTAPSYAPNPSQIDAHLTGGFPATTNQDLLNLE